MIRKDLTGEHLVTLAYKYFRGNVEFVDMLYFEYVGRFKKSNLITFENDILKPRVL